MLLTQKIQVILHATHKRINKGYTTVLQVQQQLNSSNCCPLFMLSVCLVILGILAGIWPCGVITLVAELFLSESVSQVYGSIHSLYYMNPMETADISEFANYHEVCTHITYMYILLRKKVWLSWILVYNSEMCVYLLWWARARAYISWGDYVNMNTLALGLHHWANSDIYCHNFLSIIH